MISNNFIVSSLCATILCNVVLASQLSTPSHVSPLASIYTDFQSEVQNDQQSKGTRNLLEVIDPSAKTPNNINEDKKDVFKKFDKNINKVEFIKNADTKPKTDDEIANNLEQTGNVPELQVGCEEGFTQNNAGTHKKIESNESHEKSLKRHRRNARAAKSRHARHAQNNNNNQNIFDFLSQFSQRNGNGNGASPIIVVMGPSIWYTNDSPLWFSLANFQNRLPVFVPQSYPPYYPNVYPPYSNVPPTTQAPSTNTDKTTIDFINRFGGSTTSGPSWGEVDQPNNNINPTTQRPPSQNSGRTRRPTPPLIHDSSKGVISESQPNSPPRSPVYSTTQRPSRVTSRPLRPQIPVDDRMETIFFQENPSQALNYEARATTTVRTTTVNQSQSSSNNPAQCVWAIVSCCKGSVDSDQSLCFDNFGCEGAFWDINPCSREFAQAALLQAAQFYNSK